MKRATIIGAVTVSLLGGYGDFAAAAPPATTIAAARPTSPDTDTDATRPGRRAQQCLKDLSAFSAQIQKGGYWLGGSPYGYGYAVGGPDSGWYGDGVGDGTANYPAAGAYRNARPGYEVRVLLSSANILARHGEQQGCETVLGSAREIYTSYALDQRHAGAPLAHVSAWEHKQIASAQSVDTGNLSFRSDQLVGTEVRNTQDQALGSVDDLVTSPKDGKIAYLIIGRGGLFGIDEKYVAVPWDDFKATTNVNLLILDSTISEMDGAPQVTTLQMRNTTQFEDQSQRSDTYWKATLSKAQ